MEGYVCSALFLSFLAGSATLIGGFVAFFVKKHDLTVLSIGMGFSAGVMIYVSFMELLPVAIEYISASYSGNTAKWIMGGGFLPVF